MHSGLDELDASFESSLVATLFRRRSRIGSTANNDTRLFAHIAENDDENERAAIRRQSLPSSPTSSIGSTRRSLNMSHNIAQMLPAQVQEGIEQCVKLNVENKINTKNAFNLKIIDFMMYIVRKKDMESKTLQVATSALDVSAKVYSLRVDSLHQMVIGLSKGTTDEEDYIAEAYDNNNDDNNNYGNHDGQKNSTTQKKRWKKYNSRLTTLGALQGETETVILESAITDADFQTTDMLLQVKIPQHCGQGLQLHLYQDIILDNSDDVTAAEENSTRIKWPIVYFDDRVVIDSSLINFQFLNWSPEAEIDDISSISCREPHTPSIIDDHFAFDLDASLPEYNESIASNANIGQAMDIEEQEFIDRNAPIERQVEHIVDVQHIGVVGLMAHEGPQNLEYSFFGDAVKIEFAGPTHWNVKVNKKMGNRHADVGAAGLALHGRRKREFILKFDEESMNIAQEALAQKGRGQIRHQSWREDKLILPRNIQLDPVNMKKCHLRPDDIIEFTAKPPINATAVSEIIDEYNYDNENDQEYCGAIVNDQNRNNDVDIDENLQPNHNDDTFTSDSGHTFVANASTQRTESLFMDDNLADMPQLTPILQISHNRRAKRINMRKLKMAIWIKLVSMNNNSEAEVGNEIRHGKASMNRLNVDFNTNAYIGPQIKFSQVYSDLPTLLSIRNTADLSFHVAMVALLQLANEKNLMILNIKNLDEYLICLPQTGIDE